MSEENVFAGKKKLGIKGKAKVESALVQGERVVETAVIHPGIYWQTLAVFVLAIIVGLFVFPLGVLLAVVSVLMFGYNTLKKEILLLVLTNKRIFVRYGILQVDLVDINFSKIESIELERMPTGYLMGYANVIVMGTGQRYITIPYVGNGPAIRQAYNQMTLADEGVPASASAS
ncbi:MAG: PH domain-containing protein [Alphaproteobacteria bacterium]|nr:PH domain-containing protein [Alphaproteobacteria bacterium]